VNKRKGILQGFSIVILVVFIALQSVGQYVVASLCKLNEDYMAEKLCELRSRKNSCRGKCHPPAQTRNTGCSKMPCGNGPCKKAESSITTYMLPTNTLAMAYSTYEGAAVKVPIVRLMLAQQYTDAIFQPPRCSIA